MVHRLRHVLLADDDPDDREFFVSCMKRLKPDVRITTANDCAEMLAILQHSPPKDLPDLIVIDYNMPKLKGPECLNAAGGATPYGRIPKVVWSTSKRREDAEKCLAVGATRFVTKPGSMAELDSLVNSLESMIG